MRSVWFVVFDVAVAEVKACLAEAGFEHLEAYDQWNYLPERSGVRRAELR